MPLALGAEICYCAKYLGFLVGPEAKGRAWDAPCRKLLKRARYIRTLGLSLNEAILAFCVFAFSVIRYTLQLVPLSPVLIWNFGLALDICTSTPRYSLGTSVLCSLRRLGMPIEVPDLPSTSRATMFRTAAASGVLDRVAREVCEVRESDEAVLHPRHSTWLGESTVYTLVRNKEELAAIPGVSDLLGRRVQWGVMKILRGGISAECLIDTISRRLQYFGIGSSRAKAEIFIFNMNLISSFIKPFVAANMIKTVCNAHPTARRFPNGGSHSSCRFGCYAVGGDSVLHYPFCPVVSEFVSETVGVGRIQDVLWIANFFISHFFLLERVHIGDMVRTALFCDIFSHSFNSRRASATTATSHDTMRARRRVLYTRIPCARRALEGDLRFS